MGQPQQPELRRSGRGRTTQEGKHIDHEADGVPEKKGRRGKVPPENRPGRHPDDEQDKPQPLPRRA